SAETDENAVAQEVEPSEAMTAEGYDEAVENGVPYTAEPEILARYSADPVAVTESEPFEADEVLLMEPGRDLRPDTITPAPDLTSTEAAASEHLDEIVSDEAELDEIVSEVEELAMSSEQTSAPNTTDDAASVGGSDE